MMRAQRDGKRVSLWKAVDADSLEVIGAHMVGSHAQAHYFKFGSVGVLPEYRRQRVMTSLYFAALCQKILEGRRLVQDSIVENNKIQIDHALPSLGMEMVANLRHKTMSGKGIYLFQISLMDEGKFEAFADRVPPNVHIEVETNPYCDDLWEKNMSVYEKHMPEMIPRFEMYRRYVQSRCEVREFEGVLDEQ